MYSEPEDAEDTYLDAHTHMNMMQIQIRQIYLLSDVFADFDLENDLYFDTVRVRV